VHFLPSVCLSVQEDTFNSFSDVQDLWTLLYNSPQPTPLDACDPAVDYSTSQAGELAFNIVPGTFLTNMRGTNRVQFTNYVSGSTGLSNPPTYQGAIEIVPRYASPCYQRSSPCYPGLDEYWLTRIQASLPSGQCTLNHTYVQGVSCDDSFMTCGQTATTGCQTATSATALFDGAALPTEEAALVSTDCGTCAVGYEGVGCYAAVPSYAEMVRQRNEE
jgi:hypothetical protein